MRASRGWFAVAAVGITLAVVALWRATRPEPAADAAVAGLDRVAAAPAGPSWAPQPAVVDGLRTLARASADGFTLATAHGPVRFLAGVNLGSTTPGHQPGELSITADEYRAWFAAMGHLGVRVVRIYTIHPPAFYTELRRYNEAHRQAPLYLMQGVYLPDESYLQTRNLYAGAPTAAFTQEMRDAVSAVHGGLDRAPRRGRASGQWRADVSDWMTGWIIGVEWDPVATSASERDHAAQPAFTGRYFASKPDASPTERWLAARMDEMATAQAQRGRSVPIAFVNWPTTDPLRHPDEPLPQEDLVNVDTNHIAVSAAWPAGQFASYHAYPYYPDFQRHEPGLAAYQYKGRFDPYAGYLNALKRHHAEAGIPVLVTEFGQPSATGSAHHGPLDRSQGNHSEQEAMRLDAELLHLIKDVGLSGGLLFGWADEWFKFTWNTITHQVPAERRQLWHDPLTNEQWFGLLAMDPTGLLNPDTRTLATDTGEVKSATARVDESYIHLDVRLGAGTSQPVILAMDPVPALTGPAAPGTTDTRADVALVLDPPQHAARLWIRHQIDPVPLDYAIPPGARPGPVDGWQPLELIVNRDLTVPSTGQRLPIEFLDISEPRWGNWDPTAEQYDSRSVWNADATTLRIRLPWALAGMADPSSHRALLPSATDHTVTVPGIGLTVTTGSRTTRLRTLTWQDWNRPGYRPRLKTGAGAVRDALVSVS